MKKQLLGIVALIIAVAWAATPHAKPVIGKLSINDIKTSGTKTYAVETSPDRVYFVEKVDALFAANMANVKF